MTIHVKEMVNIHLSMKQYILQLVKYYILYITHCKTVFMLHWIEKHLLTFSTDGLCSWQVSPISLTDEL